jgi:hypothetical protein
MTNSSMRITEDVRRYAAEHGITRGSHQEVPLETFFHKIVMIRNNLRVLEQKVNASDKLSEADKFDLQQYITRCYGSFTTFNILFKNKDDQFRTSAVDRPNG